MSQKQTGNSQKGSTEDFSAEIKIETSELTKPDDLSTVPKDKIQNSINETQNLQSNIVERKKQNNQIKQSIDNPPVVAPKAEQEQEREKGTFMTSKQLKKITKKLQQFERVKGQYQKLYKNYEGLRIERDQFKATGEDLQRKNQNYIVQIENMKKQQAEIQKELQKTKRELQISCKKNQQIKKNQSVIQSLEQKVKQLGLIVDMTTKSSEQQKKAEQKLKYDLQKHKQLLKLEKQALNNIKSQVQRLRTIESQTFVLKQELVRIGSQYKNLKAQKEQMPIMMDKFEHQEQMISQLKQKIKQNEQTLKQSKNLNQKFQKKINQLLQEKKDIQKKLYKVRCDIEQTLGERDALKLQLQEERNEWEVQKKRYTTQIKTLKTQLHHQHEKLKITEWQLVESRKKQKKSVQIERVNIMSLSKQDLLNIIEEMEMKNQSLKLSLNELANTLHKQQKKIEEQIKAIMTLGRQITKDYPNLDESEGMEYVQKQIIEIGLSKKDDWGQIVEKVMIENLRLKYSVTALGQQYNLKLRKQLQK